MSRHIIIVFMLLAIVFHAPAYAAGNSSGASDVVRSGGLECFSIRPPNSPTKPETKRAPALYQSCDELCAAKGAACTAITGTRNPPYDCDAQDYDPDSTLCRCCASPH